VVLITPPCMDEALRLQFQKDKYGANAIGRLDRTNEHTAKYAAVAKRVAATAGVPCVDLFALTTLISANDSVGSGGGLFEDGIHFNAAGQRVVFEGLKACLESMEGRGLHSSTFQLNLSRLGHTSPCSPV
jgi:lysophospholipase L1-like esterase